MELERAAKTIGKTSSWCMGVRSACLVAAGSSNPLTRSRSGGIENVLQEPTLQLFPDAAKIPKFKILWDLRPSLHNSLESGVGSTVTAVNSKRNWTRRKEETDWWEVISRLCHNNERNVMEN